MPILTNNIRKYPLKRNIQRTFNKISKIQTVLLKGHSCFEETKKKKKPDKQQNGQHSKWQN